MLEHFSLIFVLGAQDGYIYENVQSSYTRNGNVKTCRIIVVIGKRVKIFILLVLKLFDVQLHVSMTDI